MNRVPAEIVYRIVYLSDDEAGLVALAATSRWLYACVAAQRKLWRLRFERDFPKQDKNEQHWLQLCARTHLADRLFAQEQQEVLLQTDELLDWFRVYCSRRATEYRWRHGLYTVRQAKQADGTCVGGIRLQSIITAKRTVEDLYVLSQRILAPQQQPVWIFEQPCWDGVDTDCTYITEHRLSNDYLVVAVEPPALIPTIKSAEATLYAWHLDALHLPPRLIMSDFAGSISLHKNWLVAHNHFANDSIPGITFVFELDKHTSRPGIIEGGSRKLQVQQATSDSVRILCRDKISAEESHAMVSWQLWDFTPDRAPPTQCLAAYEAPFYAADFFLATCRIDDSRFIVYNFDAARQPTDTMPPTIALMTITESSAGVAIKETWSLAQELNDIELIVSRNMILLSLPPNHHKLLNLSDGSLVHDIPLATLDFWSESGLYPVRSQWANMTEKDAQKHLHGDPTFAFAGSVSWSTSPNAKVLFTSDPPAVADYSR
ncbi:hypothetical protein THASP1DRAFT_27383 [Thamnocephalis sphaerospora]|uniref:F-box domain-containing protein n=1 Tax=Thamnocephalis sphaerospora TaxID=78915 RepID=A0A4P9XX11_9FUNG|nr:hypothetical protein THASP1DRAFT_27383 [Thamnocephalis sphaerospora]|eukprot:RKP10844.1 hypothetical protein THASP1DRAFT_27383 [Thamnocephalis sphaerospora]